MNSGDQQAYETARRIVRSGYSKLIAYMAKQTRDVAAAEDALSEAFAAALRDWPQNGVPDKPEAWLLAVGRRKSIDGLRRRRGQDSGTAHLRLLAEELDAMIAEERPIPDERLALMFACAHPAIDEAVRSPLILQTILGFTAEDIGSAFLVSPSAMGQRLSRAKAKIKLAGIPFRVPERQELPERLEAVLEAVYAAFSTAWIDPGQAGDLADEAIWLGRLICELLPNEPEALGLAALMLFLQSRRATRLGPGGEFVPLSAQEPERWDLPLIAEAERLLARAQALGAIGRYQLEAAIQSVHAARGLTGITDWPAIAELYDALLARHASPVIAINRAVALAEVQGTAAGLAAYPALEDHPELNDFQPYWAALAALLARAGQHESAREAFGMAIGLSTDPAQRIFLLGQRTALDTTGASPGDLPQRLRAAART